MIDEHMAPSGNPGGALGRVLDRLQNVSQEGRGWKASCPLPGHGKGRGDIKPSLSVGEGDDGRVLLKCHVGCTKAEILDAVGLSYRDLFEKPASNGHKAKNGYRKVGEIYDYTDEAEKLLFQSLRYEPKDFKQRKPDGAGGWVYQGVFKNGTRPVLYRLPKVLEAVREGRAVWVVEGEKDVHRMEEEGFTATTNPMGAETWPDHLSEPLVGADVRIVGDNDEAGRRHALKVARSLHGKAASVKIVELPGVPEDGGDVSDWFDAGGTDEELEDLAAQGSEWEPPEPETKPGGKTSDQRSEPEFRLTDTGNAERLVHRHGEDLRYIHPWKAWLVWSGKNWKIDNSAEIQRRAKETVRSIYGEAQNAPDSATRRELAAHATKCESASRRAAMISLAESEEGIPTRIDALDSDPWLLNVQNGILDLRTGVLREHRREDLLTKLVPVAYEPEAECPRWELFLKEVLVEEDVIEFVRRFAGYSLTGSTRERCIAILHGDGKNGKSTLIEVLRAVLGDYAKATSPETILAKKYEGVGNDVAALAGVRLAATSEIEKGRQLAEARVKQITGGDTVTARFLFSELFEFRPEFKLWLSTNNVPEISGTDDAIWDRIRLVPFEQRFDGADANKNLREELLEELPGILAWMVRGCAAWQRDGGLGESERVKKATADYRNEMDPITDFIKARCVVRTGVWVPFAALYAAYTEWCGEYRKPETKTKFGNRLKSLGHPPANGTGNVAIREGIALRSAGGPDDPSRGPSRADEEGPRVNRPDPESPHTSPQEGRLGDEAVNSVNDPGEKSNSQNTCKTHDFEERVNPSYPKTNTFQGFSSTREPFGNPLTSVNSLTPEQERESADGAPPPPPSPLEDLFSDPPDWLAAQIEKCREDGERYVKPTCATAAGEVFGTVTRWAEVEPVLRRHLENGGRTP